MNDRVLRCSSLRKLFKTEAEVLEILKGVDFELEGGVSSSITGPSGCGKSTLLSILGGLDKPSSGSVLAAGVDLSAAGEEELARFRASAVGFVFQSHYLLKDFSALENVMLPAFMLSGDRAKAEAKARPLLDAVGLGDRLNHTPSKLSGGERQRVAIARALINDPAIVLADEPTGSLDEANAKAVEDLLFSIVAERGATLLIVTHDARLADRAHRRYHLSDGILSEL
ncbi:MAG TPA: lipoprotein-releasing system ATP-binding protein LolD [Spirochaetaceae bacterium]|nr:lipoprotein-releasing system ATP-binding protein LolD [Spirochaetaceae bacterium]